MVGEIINERDGESNHILINPIKYHPHDTGFFVINFVIVMSLFFLSNIAIAVVATGRKHLDEIAAAVQGGLGPEAAAKVGFHTRRMNFWRNCKSWRRQRS